LLPDFEITVTCPIEGNSAELFDKSTLMHVRVELSVPRGQMAGEHRAQSSLVMQQKGDGWAITSLQNTLVTGMGV